MPPIRGIFTGAIFFLITFVGAVIGYVFFGCTPFDAIYMVIITIFGVGLWRILPYDPREPSLYDFCDCGRRDFSRLYCGRHCADCDRRGNSSGIGQPPQN